jgi:hypothetical protein
VAKHYELLLEISQGLQQFCVTRLTDS